MGQEIGDSQFSPEDFQQFAAQLQRETGLFREWLNGGRFATGECIGGFELEAWLVDAQAHPAPLNGPLLERLGDPLVVPELARFNLELNGTPQRLHGDALSRLASELQATWNRCHAAAAELDTRLAMIGILPTVSERDLVPAFMSDLQRYRALDEQLRRLRGGAPLQLSLAGQDRLEFSHQDVMLEAATTSFQLHLMVDAQSAGRCYNASKIASAVMVAVAANSPYLFGADLWDETRIPLFEQSVQLGDDNATQRVSFGTRYIDSILDCFEANLQLYPPLLPRLLQEPESLLPHLRLHNGTIWRWNRPLVGFDEQGEPHLRIEHRVLPAGPTVVDLIANAALYFGLVRALVEELEAPEQRLPFALAKQDFYNAARHGLAARIHWLDGAKGTLAELFQPSLLPLAQQGLVLLGIDRSERDYWLGIIAERVASGQNGAIWQRRWVAAHGNDMQRLTEAYLQRQQSGRPVHEWTI